MITGGWIITNRETGEAVLETFDKRVADAVNTAKYRVETAHAYLVRLNVETKEGEESEE